MIKKLYTPFKIWLENDDERKLFIETYQPAFQSTNHYAYFWYGNCLAHQYNQKEYFEKHKYPELTFQDLLIEPIYEIY